MTSAAASPDAYFESLPADRQEPMRRLRETLRSHLPEGFEEGMGYGMVGYCVPHRLYPAGYHCTSGQPLPFLSMASQKNFIALYHMGLYADPELLDWFTAEWPKHVKTKLDMGKSCIRFKKPDAIPYELIGQLAEKMTPDAWIALYERGLQKAG